MKKAFRYGTALFISFALLAFMAVSQEGPKPEEVIIVSPEPSELTIEIWTDKTRYSPGERLKLYFNLSRDAYVYIYDIDTEGEVRLIFPNAFVQDSFVKAGKHTLPDKRYSFVVSGPEGVEFIQAIAATSPVPILSLAPQTSFEKEIFPLLGMNPKKHKLSMGLLLKEFSKGWAAGWTYFLISQRSATLSVITQPAGAKIYLDERFMGETPRELEVEPGRIRVKLIKRGYEPWAETIYLENKALAELKIQLSPQRAQEPKRPLPPRDESIRFEGPSPFSSFGLNAGANRENIFSLGFELGLFKRLGMGASFTFTGEPVPDYFDVGEPVDFENERIFNDGAEVEFYLKLSIPILEALLIEGGAGIAIQQRVHIAIPSEAYEMNPQAIEIKPNGYKDIKAYFTSLVGIAVRIDSLKISVGYHTRRGWTIGVAVEF